MFHVYTQYTPDVVLVESFDTIAQRRDSLWLRASMVDPKLSPYACEVECVRVLDRGLPLWPDSIRLVDGELSAA